MELALIALGLLGRLHGLPVLASQQSIWGNLSPRRSGLSSAALRSGDSFPSLDNSRRAHKRAGSGERSPDWVNRLIEAA
jgi:hypothetical protein